jgi:hypothetical protein
MLLKDMEDQHFLIGLQFNFAPCENTPHESWGIWGRQNEPVFTDSDLGLWAFRVPTSADDLLSDVVSGAWISCGLFTMA